MNAWDIVQIFLISRTLSVSWIKEERIKNSKDKFSELTGRSWRDERDACDFYRDQLSESLAHASGQSLESARQSIEKLEENFPLSIRNFSKWVNQYLDREGDKTLLFMVDEVGQFIGKNTQMMLKLQTITEDLGMYCKGRAWVVVTSQAEIDTVIGGMDKRDGDDFSKIQGRFTTKLQLSSSNTSEVIPKTPVGGKRSKQAETWVKCLSKKVIFCAISWLLIAVPRHP